MKLIKDSITHHLNLALIELKKEKRDPNKIRLQLQAAIKLLGQL